VLIAGGYLILDRQQIGLVVALDARISVTVSEDDPGVPDEGIIIVTSPQFLNAKWKYKCTVDEDRVLHVENLYHPLSISLIKVLPNRQMIMFVLLYLMYLHTLTYTAPIKMQ
jgi:phosphomevalonate kinase